MPKAYDFPYRGCLVHYEAPEIARSVLDTGTAEPTQKADVYALGASLLISATGRRRPVKAPGKLGELIDATLSHAPEDRPTTYEVGKALR